MRPILQQAPRDTDLFDIALQMLIDKAILLDTSPLQQVDSLVSMKHALRTMVLAAANKARVRALLTSLKRAVQATGSAAAAADPFQWFLDIPTKGAAPQRDPARGGGSKDDKVAHTDQPVVKQDMTLAPAWTPRQRMKFSRLPPTAKWKIRFWFGCVTCSPACPKTGIRLL